MLLSRSFLTNRCTRTLFRATSSSATKCPSSQPEDLNHAIINLLMQNMHEEDQSPTRNAYKVRAFASAIKTISQLDRPLTSAAEANCLKGIGAGIARRIEVFLGGVTYNDPKTDSEKREEERQRKVVAELQAVAGVGRRTAQELVSAGCTSLEDMHRPQYEKLLTSTQKIGLRYHAHLAQPVSRQEADTVAEFIKDNISSKFEVILVGSYRRGAQTSRDIDVVLFHPSYVHVPTPAPPIPSTTSSSAFLALSDSESADVPSSATSSKRGRRSLPFRTAYTSLASRAASPLLSAVVEPLTERGLVAAVISAGERRWRGIIRVPENVEGHNGERESKWGERGERIRMIRKGEGTFRRLDLNLVPLKSRSAALLALTGDTEFVRDIRTRAARLGMHLNEFGLWRWQRYHASDPTASNHVDSYASQAKAIEQAGSDDIEPGGYWELIRVESEQELLAEVGMSWVDPQRRNFAFLSGGGGMKGKGTGRGRPRKAI